MLQMNWTTQSRNEQPKSGSEERRKQCASDWSIVLIPDAPFRHLTVRCAGLRHVTEVPSIDRVSEQFIQGGGEIVRARFDVPGVGSLISFRDSVGQVFSFIEMESPARPETVHFDQK